MIPKHGWTKLDSLTRQFVQEKEHSDSKPPDATYICQQLDLVAIQVEYVSAQTQLPMLGTPISVPPSNPHLSVRKGRAYATTHQHAN